MGKVEASRFIIEETSDISMLTQQKEEEFRFEVYGRAKKLDVLPPARREECYQEKVSGD